MKADITRSTYNKNKKYTKVNAQQGRIQIDADWNEQLDIQEHFNKIMLCDLIGKTGTPFEESGFKIEPKNDGTTDFTIGKGHYYVDGLICENNDNIDASKQEGLPDNPILPPKEGDYVVYLDVWQRHITSLEDPTLLEPALGQTDTTTRTKNVWQAKTLKLKQNPENALTEFEKSIIQSNGKLTARVNSAQNYSGDENRLYRIEIHKSGTIPNVASNSSDGPVFKWSRENAIVAAKILSVKLNGTDLISIVIENRGKGDLYTFRNDQWIEVTDEHCELWNLSGQIFKIKNAKEGSEANQQIIDIEVSNTTSLLHNMAKKDYDYTLNIPKVRLWNIPEDKWNMHSSILSSSQTTPHTSLPLSQTEHNNKVTTSGYEIDTDNYITLEDGIQLKFEPGDYIAGDYWLIPARTITKNIEWPTNPTTNTPEALPSLMKHHYCPLALLKLEPIAGTNNIAVMVAADYRDLFSTVTDSTLSFYSVSGDGQKITPKNVFYAGSSNKVVPLVLRVGVKIGNKPITPELKDKFKVHFKIMPHEDAVAVGSLREPNTNDSGEDTFDASVEGGVASCDWIFLSTKEWTYAEGDKVTRGGQRVSATLMFKPENSSTWIEYLSAPIFFNATFAEPELCYVSGDGQDVRVETLVGVAAPVALEARVVIGGAPYSSIFSKLWRAKINFIVVKGNGKLSGSGNQPISLNDEGFVSCSWTLGDNILPQQVKAELVDLSSSNRVFGSALYFNAKLSQTSAENVLSFYTVSGDGQKITPKNVYIDSSTRGVPLVLCVGAKRGDSLITGDLQKNFFVRFDVI
ncbi:MAG: DUF6519 domain-containing protein, partial [Candidatus Bathyarchaeota archaeon]|nr:DUF6519 domain-containing protein [Candidatus Termiticorpusculum sp.]